MLKRVLALGAALCISTRVRAATAGCPNPCHIRVEAPVVSPALPSCVQIRTGNDGCECGAFLAILNRCSEAIEATDATFCYPGACRSIAPGADEQFVRWKESSVGPKQWSVHLRAAADAVEHAVTIQGNVESFGACSCTIPGGREDGQQRVAFTMILGALGAALWRRVKSENRAR